ncbi:MAG: hypothetical protein U9N57_06185 [Pseudomonadota bacterium]|nr:hypothetical protein [Pseudomonadota bacterium]
MSKRIKPNAEHRIVDGEIITDSIDEKIQRGREYSKEKANKSHSENEISNDDVNDLGDDIDPQASISEGLDLSSQPEEKDESIMVRYKSYILWILLFIIVILALFITRPNTDWQVERINDLQSEVSQLRQENNALESRVLEQEETLIERIDTQVNQALSKAENKPIVTQADLSAIQEQTQQQLTQLQEKLAGLSGQAGQQVEQALTQLNQMAQNAQQDLQPTEQQLNALKELEQKLQSQLNGLGDKLSELFEFKAEQQVLTKQPPVLKLDMPLDSLQIQQWIVEINTQWLLNGRVAETQQQLLALEQAASLSDFVYTTQLARLIGQDLGYLKQIEDDNLKNPLPDTQAIKEAVNQLTVNNMAKPILQSGKEPTDSNGGTSALDGLLEKFSQMITVKKRPEEGASSEVDSLLISDVLLQRLSLLVDRLDWGLQTHSETTVKQAVADIKQFIQRHYAKEFSEFNLLLEPFESVEFPGKNSLAIMKLDEAVRE